jgi:hypothetical protein
MARPRSGFFLGGAVVPLSQFFPRLLPHVMGCSEPFAAQALLDSAIDFCQSTLAVVETLDPITVPIGADTVEIELSPGTQVAQVLSVAFDNSFVSPRPAWDKFTPPTGPGTPVFFVGVERDEAFHVQLIPAPDRLAPQGLRIKLALSPTRTATEVPTVLFDRYVEHIINGALARLYSTPDVGFYNEPKAAVAAAKARAGITSARIDSAHGRVVTSMRVQMRAF